MGNRQSSGISLVSIRRSSCDSSSLPSTSESDETRSQKSTDVKVGDKDIFQTS